MVDFEAPDHYGELWADVYDDEHANMSPSEAQLGLLAELAGDGRALELGIGTGRVAIPLASLGVRFEGLDASHSMVQRMRDKPGGALDVTMGDMASVPVDGPFRLVYVVFNTLFSLLTQEAQVSCFRRVGDIFEPGGAFLLECFVPDISRFSAHQSLRVVGIDEDATRIDASRHDPVTQQIAASIMRITLEGASMRPVRLRYAWPVELDLMASIAGLTRRDRWSTWARAPFDAASTSHITVYEKAAD